MECTSPSSTRCDSKQSQLKQQGLPAVVDELPLGGECRGLHTAIQVQVHECSVRGLSARKYWICDQDKARGALQSRQVVV
jgi:hypothetical protein